MKRIAVLYVFASESSPDKVYQTLQYTDGTTSCDCRGWINRCVGGVRSCRHVRLVESGCAENNCKSRVVYSKRAQPLPPALPTAKLPSRRKTTHTKPTRKFDFSV